MATDPTPLVPVDTMAFPHGATQSGIQVGDAFYPSKKDAWAQLVVLDRRNLEPVSGKLSDLANKAYFCRMAGQDWPRLESQRLCALEDALRICLLIRGGDPDRYERAAVRWLGRFALEARGVTIHALGLAADALDEVVRDLVEL